MFLGLLVLGIILYVVYRHGCPAAHDSQHGHKCGYEHDAVDILRTRYAKGEITTEEFAKMHKNLLE